MTPASGDGPPTGARVAAPPPPTRIASRDHPPPPNAVNRDGRPRLPYGHLAPLVLAQLHRFPHTDFSPYDLAKVLHRSHGSIRQRLLKLADAGIVTRTSVRPARFQINP
jgi:hypothetical protein